MGRFDDEDFVPTLDELEGKPKKHEVTVERGIIKPQEPIEPLKTYTISDLEKMDLEPPEFIVADKFPVGLGIIAAPSKMGKSWLVLDMGLSLAAGRRFLSYDTKPCGVLYLALEDSLYRVNDRINKVMGSQGKPANFWVSIDSRKTNDGLVFQIEEHLEKYSVKLVIVDTYQMIKPPKGSRDAYEFDYEIMGKLKPLTVKYNICILLVHHTRKNNGLNSDSFEKILGSTAIQGATDFMYVMEQDNYDKENVILHGRGRDIEETETIIKFDKKSFRWINQGDLEAIEQQRREEEYYSNPIAKTIKTNLDKNIADPEELNEYVVRMRDLIDDIAKCTGVSMVTHNEKRFGTEVAKLDPELSQRDRIEHIYPAMSTRHRGIIGKWHRYKYSKLH